MKQRYPQKLEVYMQLHFSRLSECDRRQYAAIESIKYGRGGVIYMSELLGISRRTISQGRKELAQETQNSLPKSRQRKNGGGRKKNEKRTGCK